MFNTPTIVCALTLQASGLLHMTEAKFGLVMDPQAANVFPLKLHMRRTITFLSLLHRFVGNDAKDETLPSDLNHDVPQQMI